MKNQGFKRFCFIFAVASLLTFTACRFNPFSDPTENGASQILGTAGQSKVAFSIVLPQKDLAGTLSAIRTNNTAGASVTFRLLLMNKGNASEPFFVMEKRCVVNNGKADVEFSGIPAVPVVAEVQIENGSIIGYTDFHGAGELYPGSNTLYLAPVGSKESIDIIAQTFKSALYSSSIFMSLSDKPVTAISSLVPAGNVGKDYSSTDALQALFKTLTSNQLMKLEIPADSRRVMFYQKDKAVDFNSSTIWASAPVIPQAAQIIRSYADEFGLVRWLDTANSDAYLTTLASDGSRLGTLKVPNGEFSQIIVLSDGSIITGGKAGTPFLCRWSGKSNRSISEPTWTAPEWNADLSQFAPTQEITKPSITFVQLMGKTTLVCGMANLDNRAVTKLRVNVTTGSYSALSEFTGFSLVAKPYPRAIKLGWTPVSGEKKYTLFFSTTQGQASGGTSIEVEDCSYEHNDLSSENAIYYVVKTGTLASPRWSNEAFATPLPPEETGIGATLTVDLPEEAFPGSVIPLFCEASSSNGLELSYSWTASPGIIVNSRTSNATWTPANIGTYTIFCTVTDLHGKSETAYHQILVKPGLSLANVGDVAFVDIGSSSKITLLTPDGNASFAFILYALNQATDTLYQFQINDETTPGNKKGEIHPQMVVETKEDFMRERNRRVFPLAQKSYRKWLNTPSSIRGSTVATYPEYWTFTCVPNEKEKYLVSAKLRYQNNKNCAIYVDTATQTIDKVAMNANNISDDLIAKLGEKFDTEIYKFITEKYGPTWDKNRDSRITILITPLMNKYSFAGMFDGSDLSDDSEGRSMQNDRDMFYIEAFDASGLSSVEVTLVHEFQHLVNFVGHLQGSYEESWLDEGLAVLSEIRFSGNAKESSSFIKNFVASPTSYSLTNWQQQNANYGASCLFALYIYEQLGEGVIRSLCQCPLTGIQNVNENCWERGGFQPLFKSFCAAIFREGRQLPANPVYDYKASGLDILKNLSTEELLFNDYFVGKFPSSSLCFIKFSPQEGYSSSSVTIEISDISTRTANLGLTIVRMK
ncbi:MAG: hypothetical protein WA705_16680 [Candidatus Ozemobacteraceae bacterium]